MLYHLLYPLHTDIQLFNDPDRGWRIIHMIWDNAR